MQERLDNGNGNCDKETLTQQNERKITNLRPVYIPTLRHQVITAP